MDTVEYLSSARSEFCPAEWREREREEEERGGGKSQKRAKVRESERAGDLPSFSFARSVMVSMGSPSITRVPPRSFESAYTSILKQKKSPPRAPKRPRGTGVSF